MYSARTYRDIWSEKFLGYRSTSGVSEKRKNIWLKLLDRSVTYLEEAPPHHANYRIDQIQRIEAATLPMLHRLLTEMGLRSRAIYENGKAFGLSMKRMDLVKKVPELDRLLPHGYDLVYAPLLLIRKDMAGNVNSVRRLYYLPQDFFEAATRAPVNSTIVHESVHVELARLSRTEAFPFFHTRYKIPAAYLDFFKSYFRGYASEFTPEEPIALAVEVAYMLDCLEVNPGLDYQGSDFNLIQARLMLNGFLGHLVPLIKAGQPVAQEGASPAAILRNRSQEIANLEALNSILSSLYHSTTAPGTEDEFKVLNQNFPRLAGRQQPIWDWLAAIGFDVKKFRPSAERCLRFE